MKWLVSYALLLVASLICVPRAHAAGGACRSSANMDGGSNTAKAAFSNMVIQ